MSVSRSITRWARLIELGLPSAGLVVLSLPLTTTIGFLIFGEVPEPRFYLGAALILGSALAVAARPRTVRQRI
ncbi:hypothetical protein [Pontivivens nitratireducens]|uniref:EamA domain-containing protein n=1 Tax=Pontivivens nitratireducens TaxID=2758038 RepID=A0A6G7VH06_9RHOB|nr:hypothetical protein [Pontibrevibacter nitratireducens]QIK39274.1 hypothetical protein G8E03_01900 [Pontibrevibacter nitratireducens]